MVIQTVRGLGSIISGHFTHLVKLGLSCYKYGIYWAGKANFVTAAHQDILQNFIRKVERHLFPPTPISSAMETFQSLSAKSGITERCDVTWLVTGRNLSRGAPSGLRKRAVDWGRGQWKRAGLPSLSWLKYIWNHDKEESPAIGDNVNWPWGHYAKWNESYKDKYYTWN